MKVPQYRPTGGTTISMTPMIDIVFLLIIFFLVSSHMASRETAQPIDLPSASTALASEAVSPDATLNILSDGAMQLQGQTILIEGLAPALRRIVAADGPMQLRIRTDRTLPYERVEKVLIECSQAGVTDLHFGVFGEKMQR
jgi:biopolymer transport protein ExbD